MPFYGAGPLAILASGMKHNWTTARTRIVATRTGLTSSPTSCLRLDTDHRSRLHLGSMQWYYAKNETAAWNPGESWGTRILRVKSPCHTPVPWHIPVHYQYLEYCARNNEKLAAVLFLRGYLIEVHKPRLAQRTIVYTDIRAQRHQCLQFICLGPVRVPSISR